MSHVTSEDWSLVDESSLPSTTSLTEPPTKSNTHWHVNLDNDTNHQGLDNNTNHQGLDKTEELDIADGQHKQCENPKPTPNASRVNMSLPLSQSKPAAASQYTSLSSISPLSPSNIANGKSKIMSALRKMKETVKDKNIKLSAGSRQQETKGVVDTATQSCYRCKVVSLRFICVQFSVEHLKLITD